MIEKRDLLRLRKNTYILYRAQSDHRVSTAIKVLTWFVLAYILSPIDLIPDFVPILGLLDEIILVPVAVSFLVRRLPDELKEEYLQEKCQTTTPAYLRFIGMMMVITLWLLVLAGLYHLIIY